MTAEAVPDDRRYTKTHEWVKVEGSDLVVGITDHAQGQLTDIVFVDLPAVGKDVKAGGGVLTLESVKTVADVYAPVDGKVSAVNTDLKTHPELINKAPYAGGWLYKLTPASAFDPSKLLDAAGYRASVGA